MSAENIDGAVFYEQLENLEDEFEEVELELLRQQAKLTKDLYAKRAKVIAQIPSFWPLVFEQAPPDIDEYVQPTDSAVLLSSLVDLSVERFELPDGDPRSIAIKFEFSENEYFENKVLEKKFWWRRNKDGWAGLVSEPVKINWKPGKDLTSGLLDLVYQVWEDDKAGKGDDTEAKKKLREQMESTGLDGVSFFAWFGFRGLSISEEENQAAVKEEQAKRQARKEGKPVEDEDEEDDEDDDEDEYEMEIFPTADDLAVCIAEDLWPGAIKYFLTAQEMDGQSDLSFESDEEMDEAEAPQPSKKRKA
ncbi:nucleosome assembly protein [Trichoderma longibrachiatum]